MVTKFTIKSRLGKKFLIFLCVFVFIFTLCSCDIQSSKRSYQEGYDDGYESGYETGYESGYLDSNRDRSAYEEMDDLTIDEILEYLEMRQK